MKIAYSKNPNGRGVMRERHRRDRALKPLLRERYPKVASLRLDFNFRDTGPFTPAPQVNVMHPPARAYFFFPCPYDDCDGEFDLSLPIDELVRDEGRHGSGQAKCCGQRSGNKGKFSCGLTLDFAIDAQRE